MHPQHAARINLSRSRARVTLVRAGGMPVAGRALNAMQVVATV